MHLNLLQKTWQVLCSPVLQHRNLGTEAVLALLKSWGMLVLTQMELGFLTEMHTYCRSFKTPFQQSIALAFCNIKWTESWSQFPSSHFKTNRVKNEYIFQRLTVEVTMCVGRFIYHEKMLEFTYQREHSNAWNSAQNSSTCLLEKDRIRGLEATTEFINGVLCL